MGRERNVEAFLSRVATVAKCLFCLPADALSPELVARLAVDGSPQPAAPQLQEARPCSALKLVLGGKDTSFLPSLLLFVGQSVTLSDVRSTCQEVTRPCNDISSG